MVVPLLTTKLYIPPPRPEWVPRPRLLARLDAGLGLAHRLILVSAPPGFGKTTLLSEWVAHLRSDAAAGLSFRERVAWVSLDPGDNALPRFLAYLIAALQTIEAGVGAGVLGALQSPGLADAPTPSAIEPLLTALLNELAALPEPVLLLLDDYHLIEAPAIHQAMTFLLDHLPPRICLVLATRADPPLPLSRLRSRGAVTELRQADLRFTPQEAAAFLNQTMGLGLRAEEVAALETRTEGWIAGLQLASLAMQGTPALQSGGEEVAAFVKAFAGDDRYIVDYLVEEVLDRQAGAVQSFLLETSILDRLSGPLCDALRFGSAVTPGSSVDRRDDSQALLEELERRNLFLVPLDGNRRWYRYHQLFADLLRHRLQQLQPDRVATLHYRASQWYEDNGLLADAVEHALAAGDFQRVADLIEPASWAHLSHGDASTLLEWLDALPDELLHSRPRLDLLYAWALLAAMQLETIEARLHEVERRMLAAETPTLDASPAGQAALQAIRGEIVAIRATLASLRGDAPTAIELAQQALDHLPAAELHLRGILADILGAAYDSSGNTAAASRAFTEAAALCQAAGNPLIALIALGNLAHLQETQGQLRQAADTCHQALELVGGLEGEPPLSVGMAEAGLGKLAYEWDQLDAAARYLEATIERGRRGGVVELVAVGCTFLVRVYQARHDLDGATDLIEEAERLVQTAGISAGSRAHLAATRARLWLQQGNLEAATHWARESGLGVDDEYDPLRQVEYIALARLLLASAPGQPDRLAEALRLLEGLLQVTEAQGWMGQALEILALQAVALQASGELERAMDALARALSLGEPEGYIRTFVDLGAPMAELLRGAARRGIRTGYVARLLAKAPGEPVPAAPSPLVEPLSDRELEVLRLIAAGLSNREIAQRLVITPGTAKWHANNIYGKLGVHSRTQAVARARELGLL
jgi:LuxR family maltose regulon positive regulatory protein